MIQDTPESDFKRPWHLLLLQLLISSFSGSTGIGRPVVVWGLTAALSSAAADRVDIWRDRCDRRSRKFLCELRKFLGKQREMLYNFTPKLRNFTDFA